MGSDENSAKTDREFLGELLKARVQAFRDTASAEAGTSPRNSTCAECGTQLSESNEFCWMCGATRNSQQPFLVTPPVAGSRAATAEPVVQKFAPPISMSAEHPANSAAFIPGFYSSAATAAVPVYEAATGPQRVPEPALFEQFYGERKQEPEEDEELRPRRVDYRIAVLAVLVIALAVLGYLERNNAKALYGMTKQAIVEQFGQFWESKSPAIAERKNAPAETQSRIKTHAKAIRRAITKTPEAVVVGAGTRAEARNSSFLRVRVEGQPGPDLISYSPRTAPTAFMGDVSGPGPQVATQSAAPPFAVTISPRESLSLLLKQVPPSYPPAARAARATGPVVLKAILHKDGNVGDLAVVTGNPLLTQAAIDAVRQWVYRPYYRNGEPMEVETLVVVDFPAIDRAEAGRKQHPGN